MTSSDLWDAETAARYDEAHAEMAAPHVLDTTVDVLADLAGDGPALELAIGTGRVGIPLLRRGVRVSGIELSPAMMGRLREKVTAAELPVTLGDMATATAPGASGDQSAPGGRQDGPERRGRFALVYLVYNTLGNLRTQAEQVACFRNAARQLRPGGRFVIELWVPGIRRLPPGQRGVPFDISTDHVGFDTYDLVTQQGTSHHYTHLPDGSIRYGTTNFRYAWPGECDLMAQLAGMELESRWADWDRSPFTAESPSHVSVWRTPA